MDQFCGVFDDLDAILGLFVALLTNLGTLWPILGPFWPVWVIFWPLLAILCSFSGNVPRPFVSGFEAFLACSGPFYPVWGSFGPCRPFGLCRCPLGVPLQSEAPSSRHDKKKRFHRNRWIESECDGIAMRAAADDGRMQGL